MVERRIVACGGALSDPAARRLREFIFSMARSANPRVCFLPTATGDNSDAIASFYRLAAEHECRPTDLPLFWREVDDVATFLAKQDVVWVAGGNTANALAVWRVHGVDEALREAWEAGCVMTGASAGMNCWFEASVTDSFSRTELAGLHDGLGWLEGSACPHYDAEEQRQPVYRALVGGGFPAGVAADDGVGLVYSGTELVEAVSWRPEGRAFRVARGSDGEVSEERVAVRAL